MNETLLQKIWHYLFGYKYYAILAVRKGTFQLYLLDALYPTKSQAKHKLDDNSSYATYDVITVRSRTKLKIASTGSGYMESHYMVVETE